MRRAALLTLSLLAAAPLRADEAARREGLELFERRVRPTFADRCVRCHGPREGGKPPRGGLRLDTPAGLLAGGSSGPSVVPERPEESPLLVRLRAPEDEERMPPDGPLAPELIDDIARWVRLGAPVPGVAAVSTATNDDPRWAMSALRPATPPPVQDAAWCRTDVDRFILAKLEAVGLRPAPEADRRTLLRRVTFDLTGLPPTVEEAAAFLADEAPDAWDRLVDRLLASPAHAERWARHWLDVARYADTKGYVFVEDRAYPGAWTYRDWVVRSLAQDLPWPAFVERQLAADVLVERGELPRSELAALGFQTLGRRFLNDPWDVADDRLDVATRGLLGLTVSCARCHDHEFEPIPQRDYYALVGVLRSASEPPPPPIDDRQDEQALAYRAEKARREAEAARVFTAADAALRTRERAPARVAAYLVAVRDARGADDTAAAGLAKERGLEAALLARWRAWLKAGAPAEPRRALTLPAALPDAAAVAGLLAGLTDDAIAAEAPGLLAGIAAATSSAPVAAALLLTREAPRDLAGLAALVAPALADPAVLDAPGAPLGLAPAEVEQLLEPGDKDHVQKSRAAVAELEASHPGAPARAHALADGPPFTAPLLRRGRRDQPGEAVPRGFLACLSPGGVAPVWTATTGRLELARAIAGHPMAARAIVNRVWGWRFGEALARTPSDLGARGERPTHPELLEWLAARFIESGGSLRRLHRLLVGSAVYRQASTPDPAAREQDPEGRLLAWFPRRRLSAEEVRDALLAQAGALDRTVGGRPVDLETSPRRTLYAFVDRQEPPAFLRTFDAPSPDAHAPRRSPTTVPQQALFLLDAPFVHAQARALGRAVEGVPAGVERVQALWARALGRPASAEEEAAALALVARGPTTPPRSPWTNGRARLEGERVVDFVPLPHFTGDAWRGGPALPDPALGWCLLTRDGGHPGRGDGFAVARRLVLPAGTATIRGAVVHAAKQGDGVRARVVSDRQGLLLQAVVRHGSAELSVDGLAVTEGETLDFVVDCRANEGWDSFRWAPEVTLAGGASFSAALDFAGPTSTPPLDPWARLAHALVLTNEWLHVD